MHGLLSRYAKTQTLEFSDLLCKAVAEVGELLTTLDVAILLEQGIRDTGDEAAFEHQFEDAPLEPAGLPAGRDQDVGVEDDAHVEQSATLGGVGMKDELGARIKSYYEDALRVYLPRRCYVVVRVDGRNFHSFTRHLPRPWYAPLADAMDAAALHLCKEMMGCRFAYGQSDEYSFLLTDLETEHSKMWFDGNVQKIVSVSASLFGAVFNHTFFAQQHAAETPPFASFDARVLAIPQREEVEKYFLWRQLDASSNSLNMLASAHYSHEELHGKSSQEKHDLLHAAGVNWSEMAADFKRGRFVSRQSRERLATYTRKDSGATVSEVVREEVWTVQREIPVFQRDPAFLRSQIPG